MNDIPGKLLVVLPNPMGDAILSGPALKHLRDHLPETHITLLGNKSNLEILKGAGFSDEIIDYGDYKLSGLNIIKTAKWLNAFQFDAVVLLTNSFRTAILVKLAKIPQRIGYNRDGRGFLLTHAVNPIKFGKSYVPISALDYYGFLMDQTLGCYHIEHTSFFDKPKAMSLTTSDLDKEKIDQVIKGWDLSENDRIIVMVPGGAFGPSKLWPAERFSQLADRFVADGNKVILLCAPNELEKSICHSIMSKSQSPLLNTLEANLNLGGVKELIRRSALVVSNDTGPCHIAAAFDVPLVTLFGPTDPRWTATGYSKETRLRVNVECGPCQKPQCITDHRCLQRIDVERVYQAACERLQNSAGSMSDELNPFYQSYDESFIPLPDNQGVIHKSFYSLLKSNGLTTVEDVFNYREGKALVKPGLGSRERLRVDLSEQRDGAVLFLKRYGTPKISALLKTLLRQRTHLATAVYDFKGCLDLGQNHISAARPIALGCEYKGLGEKRSFVMIEQLPEAQSLERLLPEWEKNKQHYDLLQDKKVLIEKVADLVRRFHSHGFYHRDLYLAHIFVCKLSSGDNQLSLIDLQRVFQPIYFKRRWLVKDLAQLYYSSKAHFSNADMMRFLHHYYGQRKLTSDHKSIVRSIWAKAQRIQRHDRKRQKRFNR